MTQKYVIGAPLCRPERVQKHSGVSFAPTDVEPVDPGDRGLTNADLRKAGAVQAVAGIVYA